MSTKDEQELVWWHDFQTRCFNRIPVGQPLLGDRFKIVVQNPFTEEWEDVWKPKNQNLRVVDSPIAEIPQSVAEPSGEPCGSPPIPA